MRALFDIFAPDWFREVCCGNAIGEGDTLEADDADAIEKWKWCDERLNPRIGEPRYDYSGKPPYHLLSAKLRHELQGQT